MSARSAASSAWGEPTGNLSGRGRVGDGVVAASQPPYVVTRTSLDTTHGLMMEHRHPAKEAQR
jgi:hypothetical protein